MKERKTSTTEAAVRRSSAVVFVKRHLVRCKKTGKVVQRAVRCLAAINNAQRNTQEKKHNNTIGLSNAAAAVIHTTHYTWILLDGPSPSAISHKSDYTFYSIVFFFFSFVYGLLAWPCANRFLCVVCIAHDVADDGQRGIGLLSEAEGWVFFYHFKCEN